MAQSGRVDGADGDRRGSRILAVQTPPHEDDPVLSALQTAEAAYRSELDAGDRLAADLDQTRAELSQARQELASTRNELRSLGERLTTTEQALQRDRERTVQLAEALRDLHRAVFSGNIYELLLRACLKLTGAARGLYITVRDQDRNLRIRAAIEINGYPGVAPSEYLKALCSRVIREHEPLVCNTDQDCADLPKPATDAERFDNFIVVPVVLLKGLDGIVIAADRAAGDFTREHVEALIAIGEQATVAMENHQLRPPARRGARVVGAGPRGRLLWRPAPRRRQDWRQRRRPQQTRHPPTRG